MYLIRNPDYHTQGYYIDLIYSQTCLKIPMELQKFLSFWKICVSSKYNKNLFNFEIFVSKLSNLLQTLNLT